MSRPKGLYLWDFRGGVGKTEWARSLGSHIYLTGDCDIKSAWNSNAKYLILDDISIPDLKKKGMWKGFMSGQKFVTLRDLHFKKVVPFGLPCICLSNERPKHFDDWDNTHIIDYNIEEKLHSTIPDI